jgi:hypothetical protein
MSSLRIAGLALLIAGCSTPSEQATEVTGRKAQAATTPFQKETFVLHLSNSPGFDGLNLTVGPGTFLTPFPVGTPYLTEPNIQSGFVATGKVRDTNDVVVGIASELEELNLQTLDSFSNWTVTVPGRGTLFGSQTENVGPLFAAIQQMVSQGVFEKTFDPPLEFVSTVGNSGKIIGGTGEFAHANGRMKETDRVHFVSLITGTLTVTDILEFERPGEGP